MSSRYSKVHVRETNQIQKVKIASNLKPKVETGILQKWQSLIDSAAKIAHVPSALIMKLHEDSIEVFLKSNSKGNPYEKGEKAELSYGLYCENVIGTQKELIVPNATQSEVWKDNNPDIDLNMISYMGFPINWPDGEVFGTVCLLDNKTNSYSREFSEYLHQLKQHIETDLQLLITQKKLKEKSNELKNLNDIKSRFLSIISHDLRGAIGTLDTFLRVIISRSNELGKQELQTMLKSLRQSASSTYNTLESLLQWSKQDLLKLTPQKSNFNLVATIKSILVYFNKAIELKEIQVNEKYSGEDVQIYADKNMIETAIRNILSNAINYTNNKGKIYVRVRTEQEHIVMEVEDTGMGMTKEEMNNLFHLSNSQTKNEHKKIGAGIGLIITKDFVEKNNATIKVDSKPNKGTTFQIIF